MHCAVHMVETLQLEKPWKFYAYDNGTGAHCPPKLQL